jgi:hypothetical protein
LALGALRRWRGGAFADGRTLVTAAQYEDVVKTLSKVNDRKNRKNLSDRQLLLQPALFVCKKKSFQ